MKAHSLYRCFSHSLARARGALLRFAGDLRAATAVEFSLVAMPLIAILLASIQIFLMFFAELYLETAAETAGRLVMTGNVQNQGISQAAFKNIVCQNTSFLMSCSKIMVDMQVANDFTSAVLTPPVITYDKNGVVSNTWNWSTGSAQSIVVLRVLYLWPVFNLPGLNLVNQGAGSHLIMATAVFKNESYN